MWVLNGQKWKTTCLVGNYGFGHFGRGPSNILELLGFQFGEKKNHFPDLSLLALELSPSATRVHVGFLSVRLRLVSVRLVSVRLSPFVSLRPSLSVCLSPSVSLRLSLFLFVSPFQIYLFAI